ncbi:hypothetical protein L6R52_16335, partial [Myxococcota bacterium]|nr:hypothetical protein [Myxococcota bacterium]
RGDEAPRRDAPAETARSTEPAVGPSKDGAPAARAARSGGGDRTKVTKPGTARATPERPATDPGREAGATKGAAQAGDASRTPERVEDRVLVPSLGEDSDRVLRPKF